MRGALLLLLPAGGCSLFGLYDETPCPGTLVWCEEECIDLTSNPESCGGCDVVCADDEFCEDAECVCRPELDDCGGTCVDLSSDPLHCGTCETACDVSCSDRACADECGTGLQACDGACVDPTSDPLHCGGCTVSCAVDQLCLGAVCRDYIPAVGCDVCGGCEACTAAEDCCDRPGSYGTICVDSAGIDVCP